MALESENNCYFKKVFWKPCFGWGGWYRKKRTHKSFICCFTPQMGAVMNCGPSWYHKLPLTWANSHSFPMPLAESCIKGASGQDLNWHPIWGADSFTGHTHSASLSTQNCSKKFYVPCWKSYFLFCFVFWFILNK